MKIIENLKGRRNYEEKKATKLGFSSLYAYFEDKILKEKKAIEERKEELSKIEYYLLGETDPIVVSILEKIEALNDVCECNNGD